MKADFNVMKDVAVHTRVSPADRYKSVQKFVTRIQECPKAMEILNDWGLQLAMEPEPIQVKNIFMLQTKYSITFLMWREVKIQNYSQATILWSLL